MGHGWLAAILPADAHRFRVADPALSETLRYAGAELVDDRPDVEIAAVGQIRGDAACAVIVVAEIRPEGVSRLVRGLRRAARSVRARLRASAARRRLRALGYERTTALLWALDRPLPLQGGMPAPSPGLPVWALVVGRRRTGPTMLDAAAELAGTELMEGPNVRQGVVVGMTEQGVLRVALGPAERQLEEQQQALEQLRALRPSPVVSDRIPKLLGVGRAGLARWTLEQRLPGRRPDALTAGLRAQCVELLVELFSLGEGAAASDPADRAAVVARAAPAHAKQLDELGSRLAQSLAGLPRGYAHGDFWAGNLLTDGDRLTGVVDWDHGGEGRLPLLDLFHLLVNEERRRRRVDLGSAVAGWLLPSAQAGGDPDVRECCRRIGLDADAHALADLALAYWLDYVARQLELYADRAARPVWMRANVSAVLAVAGQASRS